MALTKDDLQAIASLMDAKLHPVNEKLDGMEKRLDNVDSRLDGIDNRLDAIDYRLDGVDKRLDDMDKRLEYVEMKQDVMQKKLDDLAFDTKVSERAIRKDIRLLQDGQNTLIAVLQGKGILNMAAY